MEITNSELNLLQIDPVLTVTKVLDALESNSTTTLIPDPSNPFMFNLEFIAMNSAVL